MKRMLAVLAGVLMAGSAWAVPMLTISSNGSTLTVTDNLAGDMDPTVGLINKGFSSFEGWNLTVTVGATKPHLGTASVPEMDILSLVATSSGAPADDLVIGFYEDGFGPFAAGLTGFEVGVGGTTVGTVRVQTFLDGSLLNDTGFLAGGAGSSFAGSDAAAASPSGTFSLGMEVTVHHDGSGSTSFDANLHPIPEPTTMLLLGSGLLGVAGVSRRKTKKG